MKIIEIKGLSKYYGDVLGCKDVNISVEEGEIYGFIGPNGAGKSTTIRTMLSLIYPSEGQVQLFGKDAIEYGYEVRKDIGYLPSEIFYYDKMKVIDLLRYSASFYDCECEDRIQYLADTMELDLDRKIQDLSYGNKKKVGIVQGLLHSPKLIILDEPTSGLDPLMQQKFFNLIREENKNGATVFFSSHILSEVQQLCNRVAIIKDGSIVSIQDMAEMKKDNYKKFVIIGDDLSAGHFSIEGVTNLKQSTTKVEFFFKGDVNQIIQIVSKLRLKDISIEEPTLEEIFMHYYE